MRRGLVVLAILLGSTTPAVAQLSVGIGLPGVSIGINLPVYPDLVPVPGYPVYYAPQVNSNYFFYNGMYWDYDLDNWYASSWYNGPWQLVAPDAVPLFLLRVPVRYYRRPPAYFRGWASNAPPRWGDHWGNGWAENHRGWDSWNRNAVPARAPLPTYQRQYSGNRYPRAEQQQVIRNQNYQYRPSTAVAQQPSQAPRSQGRTVSNPQQRPSNPQPGSFPQQTVRDANRPSSASTPHAASPSARGEPRPSEARNVRRPAAASPASPQHATASPPRQQAPAAAQRQQAHAAAAQRQQAPAAAQQRQPAQPPSARSQERGPQAKAPAREPNQGNGAKSDQRGNQPNG